jgi:hypothetical protein
MMPSFQDPFDEVVDYDDPAAAAERSEMAERETETGRQAVFVGKLLAWLIGGEGGGDLNAIGQRTLFATSRIRPDLWGGASLAAMMPPSALRKMEADFLQNFPGISSRGSPTGMRDPATRGVARR